MAKTVWTDYLTEQAVFRFWYVLENNNFKNAIKKAQKNAKMSYSIMHNALYAGLYFPNASYEYGDKPLAQIKLGKGLAANATIANFMDRHEILKNIHAMSDCAYAIRTYAPYGYNAKMFANLFREIGEKEAYTPIQYSINPKLLNIATPNQDEQTPNKPNRYRLAKNLAKLAKQQPVVFATKPLQKKKQEFETALADYKKAKQDFDNALIKKGILDANSRQKLHNALDTGFYRSVIPNYGFSIQNVVDNFATDLSRYITKRELKGHATKYAYAKDMVESSQTKQLGELAEQLRKQGVRMREKFIYNYTTYPECSKGFINAFCLMLAKANDYDASLLEKAFAHSLPETMDILMETLTKLKVQYAGAQTAQDKKQIEDQVLKIKNAFEQSNENSI
jgi:hypothetical protein